MIKIEKTEVIGIDHAIRGMRNPMNSWDKSDSAYGCGNNSEYRCSSCDSKKTCTSFNYKFVLGENDLKLMRSLFNAGTDHAKFLRMIVVYMDITAPLYWWSEHDTYKIGTVANSCSKMHKLHTKKLELSDFSYEYLGYPSLKILENTIKCINDYREEYNKDKEKYNWWQMIQLLPSSYNQKRTVMLNYEVLKNMYFARKNHKLDEWKFFCKEIEKLPYFTDIIGAKNES